MLRVIALGVDPKVKRALGTFCVREKNAELAGVTRSITTLLFALEELQPEVVVIDEYSLGDDVIPALTSIHQASERSRLLIIGETVDAANRDILQLGVAGNLPRAEACSQIWRAITAVARGEFWLSRSQSSQLLTRLSVDELREPHAVTNLEALTPQENRVLQQCMVGHSNKEIARTLGISEQTVKIHLQHVFQKLGVRRRAELLLRRWVVPEKRTHGRRTHR
jgi:DNA-binding NarL/FixJ family response regulator